MVLSSYPVGICFSGNLPLFVGTASPTEVITVQLKKGAEIILEDSFNPDENGNLSVDYSKVVDGLLSIKVPPFVAGSYIQTDAVAQLTATFTSSNGTDVETIVFNVVKGGVAGLADHAMFLASNFLTWQPQTKEVKYHDPEFLSYYAAVAVTVKLKAYYSNSNEVVNVANLTANNLHTVNLNYGSVASLLSGQALYYDVWVEDAGGNALTSVQRYVLIDKVFDYESILLFENSVGGIDTIRLTGQIEEKNTATLSSGLFDDFVFEFDTQPERAFTINSGYLKSEREKQWSVELLNSIQKYLIIDGALTSVYSDKPEFTAIKGELPFFEITLLCSHKTKYLNLARQTNPLPNLTISTNTGGVFFLAPRLNDLPWANSNDVLLPVQFPYENFFRKISLASILNGAGGGITLEKDPTVPSHVKAITQTQINKWDNAAVGTDYFTKIEIAAILNGSPSLPGYNKANWDTAFGWGNHSGLYQPIEDQRLSTTEAVSFRGIHAQDFQSIPTAAPAPADRVPGRVYIYSAGSGGGNGTPPPIHGTLIGLQDVDPTGLANGYIPYYDAPSGKFKFMANNFGSVSWTSISGRPTHLSNFVNDLGNYGNWITKVNADGWYQPIEDQRVSSWAAPIFAGLRLNNSGNNYYNEFLFKHNGLDRWNIYTDSVEVGGDSGSNFYFASYNDAGGYKANIFSVNRASGILNFTARPTIGGNGVVSNDGTTYGISISGNAASASNSVRWNSYQIDLSNYGSELSFLLGYSNAAGKVMPFSGVQLSNLIGLNTGATLINNISGNAGTVSNGIYSNVNYANPSWISSLAYGKLIGAPTALSQFANDLGLSAVYHPIENQRLSTGDAVAHRGIHAQDFQSIPTAAPAPADRVPGRVYIYSAGSGGGSGTPPPIHGTFIGLQDVDATGLANGYIPYYDAPSGKFKFMANNFGSIAWTAVTGRPTHLSNFVNDLGNYGNWITKVNADGWYQPIENQRVSSWAAPIFTGLRLNSSGGNYYKDILFKQNGLDRWNFYTDGIESGGDSGSHFYFASYTDAGGYKANIFSVNRASGVLNFNARPTIGGNGIVSNDGGTYNININGTAANSALWNGLSIDWSVDNQSPAYFLAWDATVSKFRPAPINGTKIALGLPTDSSLLHRSIGFAGGYPGANANTVSENTTSFSYANNAFYNGALVHFGNGGYGLQLSSTYNDLGLAFRSRNGDTATWNAWKQIVFNDSSVTWSFNINGSAAKWGGISAPTASLPSFSYFMTTDGTGNVGQLANISSARAALGLPTSGAYDLQWVATNGANTSVKIVSPDFGLRYVDGGSYQGIKRSGVSNEYYNNVTGSDVVLHSFTGGSGAALMDIYGSSGVFVRDMLYASRLSSGFDSGIAGSVNASNWFRSEGATGWYNQTYSGGIYMVDSTWIRTYGDKGFYVSGALGILSQASISTQAHFIVKQTSGAGRGLSLFDEDSGGIPSYGLAFGQTANYGTHGAVTGDWATYLTMTGANNRGWIFRHTVNGNVASISADGILNATKKLTAPVVEATSALAIPTGPPPVNLRESGKSYIYSAS